MGETSEPEPSKNKANFRHYADREIGVPRGLSCETKPIVAGIGVQGARLQGRIVRNKPNLRESDREPGSVMRNKPNCFRPTYGTSTLSERGSAKQTQLAGGRDIDRLVDRSVFYCPE